MSDFLLFVESKLNEVLPENLKVVNLEANLEVITLPRLGLILRGITEEHQLEFAVEIPQNPTLEEVEKIALKLRDRLLFHVANKVTK